MIRDKKKSKPADVRCFGSISMSELLEYPLGQSELNLDGMRCDLFNGPGGKDKIEDGSFQAL